MKVILCPDYENEWIDTEMVDLDGEEITVANTNGYGNTDISIGDLIMTWVQLDELKKAIALAEQRWRV